MTNENIIKQLKRLIPSLQYADDVNAVKGAIQALSQEPCDAAVSRDMALEKMADYVVSGYADSVEDFEEYSRIICQLPSVTHKSGKWILKRTFPTKLYDEHLNEYKCSECYREIRCTESQLVNYPYCHCGAKMESEE